MNAILNIWLEVSSVFYPSCNFRWLNNCFGSRPGGGGHQKIKLSRFIWPFYIKLAIYCKAMERWALLENLISDIVNFQLFLPRINNRQLLIRTYFDRIKGYAANTPGCIIFPGAFDKLAPPF
jgi:hypothetical protein